MASMQLVIKGPVKSAKRAAHRRGVAVRSCKVTSRGPRSETIVCQAPCTAKTNRAVALWYSEKASIKKGRGELPGTLLFHGASCPKDLSGPKRRKRRR